MDKPYSKYVYKDYSCDYETWSKMCSDESKPLLRQVDAVKLEHLYDDETHITLEQHAGNIKFLEGLQQEISIVWPFKLREMAHMDNLVDDYKKFYGLDTEGTK